MNAADSERPQTPKITIGIGISPRESLGRWQELAEQLEQQGVCRMWLIDPQLAMKDVYVGLALAAQRTRTMELGTGVTNPLHEASDGHGECGRCHL